MSFSRTYRACSHHAMAQLLVPYRKSYIVMSTRCVCRSTTPKLVANLAAFHPRYHRIALYAYSAMRQALMHQSRHKCLPLFCRSGRSQTGSS